jgi:transmembrane sensor
MDENYFENQSQWEKVLAILNQEQDQQVDHTELSPEERELLTELRQIKALTESYAEIHDFNTDAKWHELRLQLQPSKTIKKLWDVKWIKYAAAILILLSSLIYLKVHRDKIRFHTSTAQKDFQPGGNKAVLTLANGKRISLTDAQNGQLTKESDIIITKSKDGQLVYTMAPSVVPNKTAQINFNTIETPKGGQYQVNLPDGTKVWLNASSSLKFPSSFASAQERTVTLNGEAYFEVVHLNNKPFKVKMKGYDVKVLGTSFNISNYENDGFIATSLLTGSVMVDAKKNGDVVLVPGQQAYLDTKGGGLQVNTIDVNNAVAWKNGDFVFEKAHLFSIMKKIERWYDIDVVYEGSFKGFNYSGQVSRQQSLITVLDMLAATGRMKYKINVERKEVILMEN